MPEEGLVGMTLKMISQLVKRKSLELKREACTEVPRPRVQTRGVHGCINWDFEVFFH